jgi:hypothetical protein
MIGKFNKKCQGMPLNVIIIAVICLLVLIVLIFIFTGKSGQFTKGVESCASKGATCLPSDASVDSCKGPVLGRVDENTIKCDNNNNGKANEPDDGIICCLQFT